MGIFNRGQLRKRSFTATIIDPHVVNDFRFRNRDDIPAQAAIVIGLRTTTGKETEQQYPVGDAKNFKVINDSKGLRAKGDFAIGEQTGGGLFIAALDRLKVALDDTVEPLDGLTFRWSQEMIPGRKGTTLLPVELLGQSAESEDEEEEESDEDCGGRQGAGKEEEESEEEEEESEEDDEEEEEEEGDDEATDIDALATKAIVALLKAKKKIPIGRVPVEVHKSQALMGSSNPDRVAAAKLAGTSKFQKAKGKPWTIKNDHLVKV